MRKSKWVFGPVTGDLLDLLDGAREEALVHVAEVGDLDALHLGVGVVVRPSAAVEADDSDANFVGRGGLGACGAGKAGGEGGGAKESAAARVGHGVSWETIVNAPMRNGATLVGRPVLGRANELLGEVSG